MTTNSTKTLALAAITLILAAAAATAPCGGLDGNPANAGETQFRNSWGLALDGAAGNPALLGFDGPPRGGLSLLPLSAALWSDDLKLPLDFSILGNPAGYMSRIMRGSFGLTDDPAENSKKLAKGLRGGGGLHAGMKASPAVFATRGFGLSVSTFANVDGRIPGGLLLPLFSDTDGLLADGGRLNLSGTRLSALWATEVAVKLGAAAELPFVRDYLGLDNGAAGIGIKGLLGHAYLNAEMEDGGAIFYNTASNKYKANAKLNVLSAGTGFPGFKIGGPADVNGVGGGFDAGAVFRNSRGHALSVDVQDVGAIIWVGQDVRRGSVGFEREFDMGDLYLGASELFDFDVDTLARNNKNHVMWLPAALNVGYSRTFRFDGERGAGVVLGYVSADAGYKQQLVLGVGQNTYLPRLSAGAALGFLAGYLPVRFGMVFGGPEKLASAVGVGLDAKHISIDAFYKAVGSPVLMSANGFEAGGALTVRWGFSRVRELVKDAPEAEPAVPEAAPVDTLPEPAAPDTSAFFPDDGVEDVYEPVEIEIIMPPTMPPPLPPPLPPPSDMPPPMPPPLPPPPAEPAAPADAPAEPSAPSETPADAPAEPSAPSETPAKAPAEPSAPSETTAEESQAKPDAPRRFTEEDTRKFVAAQRAINFVPGGANLTGSSYAPLDTIANLLSQYPEIRYEVQGHTDSQGDEMANLLLSAERAAVVKYYLMFRGAPESSLIAIGYGKNVPVADNATVVGRALNRRVEFVPIQSQEHYDWLKRFELDMIPRLTHRIINGRVIVEPKKMEE